MRKQRLKILLWGVIAFTVLSLFIILMQSLGGLITYFGSGADPSQALTLIPTAPADLDDRLKWLPDADTALDGRVMEPLTREQIGSAYLLGWSQWAISYELGKPYGLKTYFSPPALNAVTQAVTSTVTAGWNLQQESLKHELQLNFYSDDGSIVSLTDHRAEIVHDVEHAEGGRSIQEWWRTYDIVMRLEDGNWRIGDLVDRGQSEPITNTLTAASDGFIKANGTKLFLDGKPFEIAGINYYPQATPWTAFLPEYNPRQTEHDLDRIAELNLNTIRIFISYEDVGGDEVSDTAIAKIRHFLDEADARELKVIATLFDHHTDHHLKHWAADDRHIEQIVPHFANHKAILAWDIKNEPDRDYDYNSKELVDGWLEHIAVKVRSHDPNHMLTIGWSTPEAAAALTDIVDLVSYHYFEASEEYGERLARLREASAGKPLVLQEFVMSTWNSVWPHGHTEAEQVYYYAELLRQHAEQDTVGYMVWTLYDFDQVPLAEFSTPWQRATQAKMGLYRRDGTQKPAALIVQPGADLEVEPLPRWHRFTKPFWLAVGGCLLVGLLSLGLIFWKRKTLLARFRN